MIALGIMSLQLRIVDFKFSHNFIICDRLPEMELLFGINVQKKFSLFYTWDREKKCNIQKEGKFPTYTRNCEQKANVAIVKFSSYDITHTQWCHTYQDKRTCN